MKELTLAVNGLEVKMNDFVRRIVTNILISLLNSLTLDESPKTAVFTLTDKPGA